MYPSHFTVQYHGSLEQCFVNPWSHVLHQLVTEGAHVLNRFSNVHFMVSGRQRGKSPAYRFLVQKRWKLWARMNSLGLLQCILTASCLQILLFTHDLLQGPPRSLCSLINRRWNVAHPITSQTVV